MDSRKSTRRTVPRDGGPLDQQTGQGPSFESRVHTVQLAELEVDAGPVINPQNPTGQLEGGMDMGVRFALREEYVAGRTRDWVTFKFPTIKDHYAMETIIRETPRPQGPLGTTGIDEMCMVPTAPAVINAIHDAVGVWVCELSATPEKVDAALALKG